MSAVIPSSSKNTDREKVENLTGQCCGLDDRYQIGSLLSESTKFQSYETYDEKLSRDVTLNIFPPKPEELAQPQLEIYSSIQHPNVCPLLDAGKTGDRQYLILRQVEGFRLENLVTKDTALAADEISGMINQLLDILITLHDKNYLHLGLAPSSILLSTSYNTECQYLITDFINASKMDEEGNWSEPKPGMFRDCFPHTAPEALNGGTADVRSDLFSLGALVYHAFCGHAPFEGNGPIEVSSSHQDAAKAPVHLSYKRPEVPDEIANWVMSLLEVDQNKRPKDALEALKSFQQLKGISVDIAEQDSRVA